MTAAFDRALARGATFLPLASDLLCHGLVLALTIELKALAITDVVVIRDDNRVDCPRMTL
jgi:hypothetical protein